VTQSNAGCSGRRAPRKGKGYRGKTCCFELAERAIEARARDRGASSAVGLDVLGSFTTINPCCATRQTKADVDRVVRASREDVDVRTDGTREAHSLPFRARVLVLPWDTTDPSTARSANLTTMGSFPQESSSRNFKWEKSRRRGWNRSRGNRPVIPGRGASSRSSHRISAARGRARSSSRRVARSALAAERRARDHIERRIGLRSRPHASQLCPFTGIPRSASMARSCSGERPSVVR
jgi:hypothetical protein